MIVNSERKIVFISCLLLVVGLAAVDFFNPSLPYIMSDLHTNQAQVKGLIVVYMVVLGVAQFFYGSFSDRRGRRPAVILSFGIAAIGLGASAFVKNIEALYLTRSLTALGTAGCTVISRAIIVDSISDGQKIKKAFSLFAMSSQLSPALAPVMGGSIQEYFGWRWSFAAMMLIIIVAWFLLINFMPETHEKDRTTLSLRNLFSPYQNLIRDVRFGLFSLASAIIFVFTVGYYSTSPYAFHALNYSAIENGLFYLSYSVAILVGSWAMGSFLIRFSAEILYDVMIFYFFFGVCVFYFLRRRKWRLVNYTFFILDRIWLWCHRSTCISFKYDKGGTKSRSSQCLARGCENVFYRCFHVGILLH